MQSGQLVLCVLLTLLSAFAFAVATVAQQRAAARSSDEIARSRHFISHLLRSPQWWAGTAGNTGGYVLQALALAIGPLIVVAPLVVTNLLFALPLSARLAQRRLTPVAWRWGLVLAVSIALFVVLGNPDEGADSGPATDWLIVAAVGAPILVACFVVASARSGSSRAFLLAVVAGSCAAVAVVLTKAVVVTVPDGLGALLTTGETYGVIVIGLAGVYFEQLAYQAGELQASLPVISVLEPLLGAVLGVALLHEQLQVDGPALALLAVIALVMTLSTVGLARSEAQLVPAG